MSQPTVVIFDVGKVLFDWEPRYLYERLIGDDQALEAFLANVVTKDWHFQHDAGRLFADTSAELIALYPEHRDLIAAWGPRFNETIGQPIRGMAEIAAELDSAGVPLFAITNFSGEFWPPFMAQNRDLFDRFQGIIVSGDEHLIKPDPAIYHLALDRFELEPGQAVFVDDNAANIDAANALGIHGVLFTDAAAFRRELVGYGLLPA